MQRKVATVNQFGFTAAATSNANNNTDGIMNDDSNNENNNENDTFGDEAFHVRVLNLIADLTTSSQTGNGNGNGNGNDDDTVTTESKENKAMANVLNVVSDNKDAIYLFAEKRSLTALLRLL